jgi:hypothetical protein
LRIDRLPAAISPPKDVGEYRSIYLVIFLICCYDNTVDNGDIAIHAHSHLIEVLLQARWRRMRGRKGNVLRLEEDGQSQKQECVRVPTRYAHLPTTHFPER